MLYREVESKIKEHSSQLEQIEIEKATKIEVDIERKRIDSFVSLPEGSTQGNAELIEARIGANSEKYGSVGENIRTIGKAINYKTSKNLFNKNTITDNTSFYADGNINSNSPGYCISDFIPVQIGKKIYGSYDGVSKTIDRYNVYNKEKTLVKSVQYFKEYTVEQDGYIRVQMQTSLAEKYQIEYYFITSYSEYHEPYYEKTARESDVELLKNNIDIKNIIVVRQDGNGDYMVLNDALNSIKDNSLTNKYLILLHEGTYNVCSYFTTEQITNAEYTDTGFVGLEVREGIYIEGVGNRDKIIIHGEVATTYPRDKREQISTLNLKGECGLENLTVTSKYIRYPIHDDFGINKNKKHIIKNCKFIHIANSDNNGQNGAYGLGTNSGSIIECEDCYFDPTFGYHNNANFEKPSVVTLKNCEVTKHISLWDFNTCGVECKLNLYNTKYAYINHIFNGSNKTPFISINGVGNINSPINCDSSVIYDLDETIKIKAENEIAKGDIVKRTSIYTIDKLNDTDNYCFGIALENISKNTVGKVQYKGYINSNFFNVTASVGDHIGVKIGELVINDGNIIGVIEFEYNGVKFFKLN